MDRSALLSGKEERIWRSAAFAGHFADVFTESEKEMPRSAPVLLAPTRRVDAVYHTLRLQILRCKVGILRRLLMQWRTYCRELLTMRRTSSHCRQNSGCCCDLSLLCSSLLHETAEWSSMLETKENASFARFNR